MSTLTATGLRARALAELERADTHRQGMHLVGLDRDLEYRCRRTEDLVHELFDLEVATVTGEVEIDGLRLGARWLTVNGYTGWRLCLLETCSLCRRDVATPLVAGEYTLGSLLRERDRGVEPCHEPEADCLRGARRACPEDGS